MRGGTMIYELHDRTPGTHSDWSHLCDHRSRAAARADARRLLKLIDGPIDIRVRDSRLPARTVETISPSPALDAEG